MSISNVFIWFIFKTVSRYMGNVFNQSISKKVFYSIFWRIFCHLFCLWVGGCTKSYDGSLIFRTGGSILNLDGTSSIYMTYIINSIHNLIIPCWKLAIWLGGNLDHFSTRIKKGSGKGPEAGQGMTNHCPSASDAPVFWFISAFAKLLRMSFFFSLLFFVLFSLFHIFVTSHKINVLKVVLAAEALLEYI